VLQEQNRKTRTYKETKLEMHKFMPLRKKGSYLPERKKIKPKEA
jgi:hypothetical protein